MSRVTINRYGFRDRYYRQEKPENTTRIAVLGDSFTFGWGVNASQTYAAVLEQQLNKGAGRHVQVLNFGIPDANTRSEVAAFENRWLAFAPDLVIIGYGYNDILNKSKRDRIQKTLYGPEGRSNITEDQSRSIIQQASNQYWEAFSRNPFSAQKSSLTQPFQQLHALSERYDFNVLLYIFSDTGGTELKSGRQRRLLENLSEQYGWGLLSSQGIWDRYSGQQLGHHPRDMHPTAFYHTQVANQLHTHLENNPCLLEPSNTCS